MASSQFELVTVSGAWPVPADISLVYITAAGGGGGGGAGFAFSVVTQGAGGGGAGEYCRRFPMPVNPGGTVDITIGDAGAGGMPLVRGSDNTLGAGKPGGITLVDNNIATIIRLYPGQGGNPNNVIGNTIAGFGGGVNHGGQNNLNNTPGVPGRPEGSVFCGGGSGGGRTQTNAIFRGGVSCGAPGGPCEGFLGGLGGFKDTLSLNSCNGGSGGAASCFGPGGAGGNAHVAGLPVPAGSYGAGGGGGGGFKFGQSSTVAGGVGGAGAVLIEFIR